MLREPCVHGVRLVRGALARGIARENLPVEGQFGGRSVGSAVARCFVSHTDENTFVRSYPSCWSFRACRRNYTLGRERKHTNSVPRISSSPHSAASLPTICGRQ